MAELHEHEVQNLSNPDRDITTVEVLTLDNDGEEATWPLVELIEQLKETLGGIPEAFHDTAKVCVKTFGDYASLQAHVEFQRPETDEEFKARVNWLLGLDEEHEARDRREYARLKAKFHATPDTNK